MAIEAMRGCGYRKVGGLYVVGEGIQASCDRLPYELKICPTCGGGVKFSRGWSWINWLKYAGVHAEEPLDHLVDIRQNCRCQPGCPVCNPYQHPQPYGLLWVGESNYTPENFTAEAMAMGVSKRIPCSGKLPTGPHQLKLGKTWILLAHIKAGGTRQEEVEDKDGNTFLKTVGIPGVFYAFRPTRLEYLIWEKEAAPEYIEDLEKRNITPVIIPDDDVDHNPETPNKVTDTQKSTLVLENRLAELRKKMGNR